MAMEGKQPIVLFVIYSQKDEALKQEFEEYLVNLQQAQLISRWVERQVQSATDWSQVIDPQVETAQLFVFLLSPSLLASGYCSGAECRKALERHWTREAQVIPILLRGVDLTGNSLDALQQIPRARRAVSSWRERSEAWWGIYQDIRAVVQAYQSGSLNGPGNGAGGGAVFLGRRLPGAG